MSFVDFNHLAEEERASHFTFIEFWLLCGCLCTVYLPRVAFCWSVVCGCGTSLSYSLALCVFRESNSSQHFKNVNQNNIIEP